MVDRSGPVATAVSTEPTESVSDLSLKLTLGRLLRETVEVEQ